MCFFLFINKFNPSDREKKKVLRYLMTNWYNDQNTKYHACLSIWNTARVCDSLTHKLVDVCSKNLCFFFKPEKFFKKEKILDTTKKIRSECAQNYRAIWFSFLMNTFYFFLYVQNNGCMCVFCLKHIKISMYMCSLEVGGMMGESDGSM